MYVIIFTEATNADNSGGFRCGRISIAYMINVLYWIKLCFRFQFGSDVSFAWKSDWILLINNTVGLYAEHRYSKYRVFYSLYNFWNTDQMTLNLAKKSASKFYS